jgi:hypothetical protein
MSGKRFLIGGLVIAMTTTVLPAPKISTDNPKLLYGAAIYKAIVGDAGSALRLLQRSEDQPAAVPAAPSRAASNCTASHPARG